MEQNTKVILVRHGQTQWNDGARFQGHLDSDLTPLGIQQAESLGRTLAHENIAAIYSSDLGRASHTAELIARATGHEIVRDIRLRERCLGVFQGLQREEASARFPSEFARYLSLEPDFAVPGGESIRAHFATGFACLNDLAARHAGQTIVVVTHGGTLQALFRHVVGIPFDAPRRFSIQNAAYNLLAHAAKGWAVVTWGDIAHLPVGTGADAPATSLHESRAVE